MRSRQVHVCAKACHHCPPRPRHPYHTMCGLIGYVYVYIHAYIHIIWSTARRQNRRRQARQGQARSQGRRRTDGEGGGETRAEAATPGEAKRGGPGAGQRARNGAKRKGANKPGRQARGVGEARRKSSAEDLSQQWGPPAQSSVRQPRWGDRGAACICMNIERLNLSFVLGIDGKGSLS